MIGRTPEEEAAWWASLTPEKRAWIETMRVEADHAFRTDVHYAIDMARAYWEIQDERRKAEERRARKDARAATTAVPEAVSLDDEADLVERRRVQVREASRRYRQRQREIMSPEEAEIVRERNRLREAERRAAERRQRAAEAREGREAALARADAFAASRGLR